MKPSRLFFGTLFYDPNGSFVAPDVGSPTLSGTVQAQAAGITGTIDRQINLSGTFQTQVAGITGNVTNVGNGIVTLGGVVITVP